jgi:hypothetical protein
MASAPYQQLARQFIDLWQKQLSTVMHDADFLQGMMDALQSMTPGVAGHDGNQPAAAAHAAASADAGADRMAQLDYRLRMCEQRLSELEVRLAEKPAPKRPGARRGGRTKKAPARPAKRR